MRAILTYHSIDASGSAISVDGEVFRSHVEWLARSQVRVLSVAELLTAPDDANAVAVTFDDAFRNFLTDAWPLLRDHGLPVTLFVPTGYVGGMNDWPARAGAMPRLPLLAPEELATLAAGGVRMEAHGHAHEDLRQLDGSALADELDRCREQLCAITGTEPEGFAYPYGFTSPAAVEAVRARFAWACTTRLDVLAAGNERHLLPRLDAYYFGRRGRLEAWGSARFRWRLRLRRAARRLRHGIQAA